MISYRRFGTTYGPHPQDSALRMGPIACPETSVRNHHYSLRNNPEECSSRFYTMFYSSVKMYLLQCVFVCGNIDDAGENDAGKSIERLYGLYPLI